MIIIIISSIIIGTSGSILCITYVGHTRWHGQRAVASPDRPAPYQTPDDALVLLSCPFFAKIPAWSSTTNSSKFTGHVSPIHQYPH